MPGRGSIACKSRWANYLNPNIYNSEWTFKEDQQLLNLHNKFGDQWKIIVKNFPDKSCTNIKKRYKFLHNMGNLWQFLFKLFKQNPSLLQTVHMENTSITIPSDMVDCDSSDNSNIFPIYQWDC